MRTTLKTLTFLWIAFWLFIGTLMFLETPLQIERDKLFIEEEIKPSVDFIKNFKETNNRLPTKREYYTWQRDYHKDYSSDLTQQVDSLIAGPGTKQYIRKMNDVLSEDYSKFKNADWTKDFAIGVWRGEWTEYYFSWSDSYDTNNYSWKGGFVSALLTYLFGFLPLPFWWYNSRQRKKISHKQS
ncbi:MAG: hypothetical protein WC150_10120 [Bacteroidia bacterium]